MLSKKSLGREKQLKEKNLTALCFDLTLYFHKNIIKILEFFDPSFILNSAFLPFWASEIVSLVIYVNLLVNQV